jgi:arylsulfatase A-like enzyme
MLHVPGMKTAGRNCAAPISLLDIFPTLNELCRLEQPVSQQLDGHSLVPLLNDANAVWPHVALTSHQPQNAAVSDSRYRYIRYSNGSEELYDHRTDPREYTNLIEDAESRAIAERLKKHLPQQWAPKSRR